MTSNGQGHDQPITQVHRNVPGSRQLSRRTALRAMAGTAVAGAGNLAFGAIPTVARQGSTTEIEIALLQGFSETDHPAMKMINAFNARGLGVEVTGTSYGANYEEVMQRAQANISAQIGPAIVVTGWKYALFADAALNIVDLREVGGDATDEVLARYRPWVVDIVRVGDKLAGLPFAVSTPILYYNRDLFAQAGLDPERGPSTWDEAAEFAVALSTGAEIDGAIVGEVNEWTAQSFIQNNGGRVLDDGGKADFDSGEAIAGMAVWDALRSDGHYLPIANDQMRPAFLAGNVPMYFTSVAGLAAISAGAEFELGTAEFPATGNQPKSMPSGGNFLGVYTQDPEQQAAAWAFLDFASSTEGVTIWNETGYLVATTDAIPPLPGQEPAYAQMEAGLTNETIWPGERGLEALSVFNDWMARIVNGDVPVEDGMTDGNAAVAALLP